jgi:hypothetical protein
MDFAVRVVKGDAGYRGRVEVGGCSVYTTAGSYSSRGQARVAATQLLAEALGALMAEYDTEASGG